MNWSDKLIDLVEVAYGLYVSRCVNGGRCDIKEIVFNRKNGRTPFLKWLCERIEQDAYEKDE